MHPLFGIKAQSVSPAWTRPTAIQACFLEAVLVIRRTEMRLRFRPEAAQRHRRAFIEGSPLVFRWSAHVRCLTTELSHECRRQHTSESKGNATGGTHWLKRFVRRFREHVIRL